MTAEYRNLLYVTVCQMISRAEIAKIFRQEVDQLESWLNAELNQLGEKDREEAAHLLATCRT